MTFVVQGTEPFAPDAIAAQIPVVNQIRELRDRLQLNNQGDAAATELAGLLGTEAVSNRQATPAPNTDESAADTDPFATLLGEGRPARQTQSSVVSKLLASDPESRAVPDRSKLTKTANDTINDLVKQVLADPVFQSYERSWLSLSWLVSELDLDSNLNLWILPVDLLAATESAEDQIVSAVQKILAGPDGGTLNGKSVV